MRDTILDQETISLPYSFTFSSGELEAIDEITSIQDWDVSCCRFFRLDELLYEGNAPQREAFQNVISAIDAPGFNFIYIIRGDRLGTHIYLGIAAVAGTKAAAGLGDFANDVLYPSFQGMFRGSRLKTMLAGAVETEIIESSKEMPYVSMVMGIPSLVEDKRKKSDDADFQGIDRLASAMHGEDWQMIIVCEPVSRDDIFVMREEVYSLYERLTLIAKSSVQGSRSKGESYGYSEGGSKSVSEGENQNSTRTKTEGTNENSSYSESKNVSYTTNSGESISVSRTDGNSTNFSQTSGESRSNSFSESHSNNRSKTTGATANSSGSGGSKSTSNNTTEGSSSGTTKGNTNGTSRSESKGNGSSFSDTQGKTRTSGNSDTKGHSSTSQKGSGTNESISAGTSDGKSHTETVTDNYGSNVGTNTGKSLTATVELVRKKEAEQLKYIDETLLPRLQKGCNRGMFKTAVYLYAGNESVSRRLCNNVKAIFQSDQSTFFPLTVKSLKYNSSWMDDFQIHAIESLDSERQSVFYGVPNHGRKLELASCLTTDEISIIAGLPQQEVPGIALRPYTAFGLNMRIDDKDIKESFELGHLLYGGQVLNDNPVMLNRQVLNKHVFVTGITGSGKTMTCKQLLTSSSLNFLVIEPAKTEYRELLLVDGMEDVVVFTVGNERGLPLRFNPFELLPGENLTSHIDMVKAAFVSSFDFEASMPQIFEMALYKAYESKGWDTDIGEYIGNEDYNNEWPDLSDFLHALDIAVKEQHFGKELEGNYRGSLVSRIANLTYGSKGKMFNCQKSVDIRQLLHRKVIFEMEELKSPQDKSLIMALIMGRLNEAVKLEYSLDKEFKHITLVEEAHRLLTKVQPGDGEGKKYAVGIFTDMLAEIRKYGEVLIIVDQIPNKLAEDVLKNTATKIVHKLVARDDKELIGDTMMLDDKQKVFLSNLLPGEAVVFTENWEKAVHVKVNTICENQDKNRIEDLQKKMRKSFKLSNLSAYCPELPPGSSESDLMFYDEMRKSKPHLFKALRLLLGNWKECTDELKRRAFSCLPNLDKINEYGIKILAGMFYQNASKRLKMEENAENEMEEVIKDLLKKDIALMEKLHSSELRLYKRFYLDFFKGKDAEKCLD